jgi:hypothetical protein
MRIATGARKEVAMRYLRYIAPLLVAAALIIPASASALQGTAVLERAGAGSIQTQQLQPGATYCPFSSTLQYSKAAFSWIHVNTGVNCSGPVGVIVSCRSSISGATNVAGNFYVGGNGCLSKAVLNFPRNGGYIGGAAIGLVAPPLFRWSTGPNSCRGYGTNILLCIPIAGGVVFP